MSASYRERRIIYVQPIVLLNEMGGNFTGNIWKYIRLLILEPRRCTQGNAVGIWESSL